VRPDFPLGRHILTDPGLVCALSSRYYTQRPGLYALATHFAKASAASAFIDGWKCVEMCQAYLMLTAYTPPTQRFEDSRSGFYSGVATRWEINSLHLDIQTPDYPMSGLR